MLLRLNFSLKMVRNGSETSSLKEMCERRIGVNSVVQNKVGGFQIVLLVTTLTLIIEVDFDKWMVD